MFKLKLLLIAEAEADTILYFSKSFSIGRRKEQANSYIIPAYVKRDSNIFPGETLIKE